MEGEAEMGYGLAFGCAYRAVVLVRERGNEGEEREIWRERPRWVMG